MQYQVPQFIEIEDKIFGQLTLKQFIYVVGGCALGFITYEILPIYLALLVGLPIVAFGFALAFYKPDGHRPFIVYVENAIKYTLGSKLYIWKKGQKQVVKKESVADATKASLYIPKLSDSKLKELTWSLDIHNSASDKKKHDGLQF